MTSRLRRRLIAANAAFVVLVAGGYAGVCVFAADSLSTTGADMPLTVTADSIGANWEDVSFPSRTDRITLRGWLFHASPGNGRSAILLHGFTANRTDPGNNLPGMTRAFVNAGYDTLVFDFRSFGLSDGNRFTIGWREGRDVLGAVDLMRSRGYDPHRMAIVGNSMGAESMLGVAEQLTDVGALISDSSYAELRPAVYRLMHKYSSLPQVFYPGTILAFQLFYGENPDFRPIDHVRATPSRAFLFLHGGGDQDIPVADAYALKAASANPDSRLIVFDGSGHNQEFIDQPQRYLSIVFGFIDQQLATA